MALTDRFGRSIDHLRISVTDRCDLHCVYFLLGEEVEWQARRDQSSAVEIAQVAQATARSGVRRAGGESLVCPKNPAVWRKLADKENP